MSPDASLSSVRVNNVSSKKGFSLWLRLLLLLLLVGVVGFLVWLPFQNGALHLLPAANPAPQPLLSVTMLDVGQGDAIHLRTKEGTDLLIDGGPDSSVLSRLSSDMPFSERSLELMLLTHPHADHFMGLFDVLDRYQVGRILADPKAPSTELSDGFFQRVQEKGISLDVPRAGMVYDLGLDIKATVLFPFEETVDQLPSDDANAHSIVLQVDAGRTCFLFMGDLDAEGEAELVSTLPSDQLACDVLKAGHHGSRTSSTAEFLDVVHPKEALISNGAGNSYGHPHAEALDRFRQRGIHVFRTDLDGSVTCRTDGENVVCTAGSPRSFWSSLFR